ncbi:MAG TPA: tetratricopeptide repeat protein [Rudaea sp.]|nr:tetratricopeptide repeat protein [Rudaea sp.]
MNDFFARLKQRKLVQWALAYVAFAFAAVQGIDVVGQQFGWPDAVRRGITVALAIGFFVTLVLAWYHGEKGAQKVTGTELLILALLLAIGGGLLWRVAQAPQKAVAVDAAKPAATPSMPITDKSIAVLPFENLSDDKANAYFADGIQDEILTKLAKIGALRVTSRTSTRHYASAPENLAEIARQLGVANILEGSVQKSGNAVHINVQLIGAAKDEHLWAESYNRTLDDVFGVEGEVAQAIADALKATLTGTEREAVAAKGTQNPRAWEAYLRGRVEDNSQYTYAGAIRAIDSYFEATREDPQFAQAWAGAAVAMSNMYLNGVDAARSTPEAVRRATDTAMSLQPQLAESLLAQGAYLYRVKRDYPAALDVYRRALAQQPGDIDIIAELFFIERRMGRWNDAIAHYRDAIARDPRNVSIRVQGAVEIFLRLRRFDETRALLEGALKIAPDDTAAPAGLAQVEMQLGHLDAAQAWLARIPGDRYESIEAEARMRVLTLQRDELALGRFMRSAELRDDAMLSADDIEGLIRLGIVQRVNGHADAARKTFERLAHALDKIPGGIDHLSESGSMSPLVYAGLGDWDKALDAAQHQIAIHGSDANEIAVAKITLAQIHALKGDRDAAIALLPELLQIPSGVTPALLALDPVWDPIRGDRRFVAFTQQPVTEFKVPSP